MSVRTRAVLAAMILSVVAGCGGAILPQIHNDSDRFAIAQRMYDKGDYAVAIDVLTPYVTSGTGAGDIDRALYLLGLTYLKQREWASAETQFSRILRDYPESDSAQSASFRLGEAWYGQAKGPDFDQEFTLKALTQWQDFVKTATGHWLLPQAEERIATCRLRLATKLYDTGDLYVKLKDYKPARHYFKSVMDEYSDTPIYGDALIGNAIVDAKLGQKPAALAALADLEKQFADTPLGARAALWHARVEKWPAAGDTSRKGHRSVESTTAPAPSSPVQQPTSFTP